MARQRGTSRDAPTLVSIERAARLHRLLTLLGEKPQKRQSLMRRLRLNQRGFYRELEFLEEMAIEVANRNGTYFLTMPVAEAQMRLPFPNPGITLGEAIQLAKGRSAVHRKLKKLIAEVTE